MIFDTHIHLNDEKYTNIDILIKEAKELGINAFLCVGYDLESSKKAIEIASKFDNVFASVGVIPTEHKQYNDGTINDYAKLSNGVLYTYMKSNHWLLSSVPANLDIEKLVIDEETYRIESFAGNANTHIKELVLPDTLKIIGNYAFFGYTNLATVEFRSFIAPSLEANYNKNAQLTEDDPGYEILHKYFDVFSLELYYYNFIDLVGKKAPIKMILPKNSGLIGYDSIVYEVYFGKDSEANHSDYEAMNKSLIQFIDYAEQIGKLNVITLSDETLINNAITALNSVNQDATKYGYSETEWNKRKTS